MPIVRVHDWWLGREARQGGQARPTEQGESSMIVGEISVLVPVDTGSIEIIIVLYEQDGTPEQTYRFTGDDASECAFERGEEIVRRLKPVLAQ